MDLRNTSPLRRCSSSHHERRGIGPERGAAVSAAPLPSHPSGAASPRAGAGRRVGRPRACILETRRLPARFRLFTTPGAEEELSDAERGRPFPHAERSR